MLSCFDFVREFNFLSITIRMLTALICGGIIGIEREYKRRPAGFRTHILICLGASITTLTSQYLVLNLGLYTDVSRLGAKVVAGIGFIGAGTIIKTKRQHVKGLTTAAGLWNAAIIGLVCGAGFVECGLFATLLVMIAEKLLIKIERRFEKDAGDLTLYIEYESAAAIDPIVKLLRENKFSLTDFEVNRLSGDGEEHHYCAIVSLSSRVKPAADIAGKLSLVEGVINIEEL